jgi:hypothetical protein
MSSKSRAPAIQSTCRTLAKVVEVIETQHVQSPKKSNSVRSASPEGELKLSDFACPPGEESSDSITLRQVIHRSGQSRERPKVVITSKVCHPLIFARSSRA